MESDLKWDLKAQFSRQNMNTNTNTNTNTNMRRFSASNFKSFREDERFLRSTTISSTVSSPGYTTRDKIDPSTYSFTAAIKALQAKGNACSWEHPPAERVRLHSKWSDAEKYISNPLSGEVPVECLSAKTLSGRSFSSLTNRITISAPLLYPSHFQTKFPIIQHQHKLNITIQEEKKGSAATRDVGTQSTPVDLSSGSPSTAPPTPSIRERLTEYSEGESGDSSLSKEKENPMKEGEERETKEKESRKAKEGRERERKRMMMMCIQGGGRRGCLSLKALLQRDKKCKPRKIKKPAAAASSSSSPTFLYHINACYDDFI